MDRNELIDRIFAQGNQIRAVLQGLHTEHLNRINRWYESQPVIPDFRSDPENIKAWKEEIEELREQIASPDFVGDREKIRRKLREIREWLQLTVFPKLVGEADPYNIYLIEWDDGRGYVGMTGQSIITRMEQHFGQIHVGIASYEFLRRYETGIGYRFHCLHTNLDRCTAQAMEVQEIKNRTNLVNFVHNQNLLHRRGD